MFRCEVAPLKDSTEDVEADWATVESSEKVLCLRSEPTVKTPPDGVVCLKYWTGSSVRGGDGEDDWSSGIDGERVVWKAV